MISISSMAKMNTYLLSQTLVLPWHSLILVNSILLVVEAKNLEITLDYSFSCLPTKTIQPHLIASPLVSPWTKPSMCVPYIIPDSFLTGLLDSTLISLQSVLNKVDKIIPLNLKANPISFFCSKPFFLQQPIKPYVTLPHVTTVTSFPNTYSMPEALASCGS